MKTRIISAAILLPVFLLILLALPKLVAVILFGLMSAAAAYELLVETGYVKHPRLVAYAMIMAFLTALWSYFGCDHTAALIGVCAFAALLFAEMMHSHIKLRFEKVCVCFAAGIVVPYLFTSMVRIHCVEGTGRFFIIIPLIMAFLSDTGAYFAGRLLGSHKLAPVISPNKTVEGAVGGILGAIVGMMIYGLVLKFAFGFEVNFVFAMIYGVLGSVTGMFGDLCFSVIKRQNGIKDYGNLIPGHGGILDRFDSMIFVGPLAQILLTLIPVAVK